MRPAVRRLRPLALLLAALAAAGCCNLEEITTEALPDATVGRAYRVDLDTNCDERAVRWSLFSGTLPPGIGLSDDGELRGTPTAEGTYTFTVEAVSRAGFEPVQVVQKGFGIRVAR